ncbi:hypothetical protein DVJ78_17660 [Humibacter sp. BT305]|nr:hypothetical protein DVJ78_17660 [Humibacter sp. BT305]
MTPRARIATALLRLVAVAVTGWALWWRADCAFVYGTCSLRNLAAYFTIESAILFGLTALVSTAFLPRTGPEPAWLTGARSVVAAYVVVSGGVFAVLMGLAGFTGSEFLVPMSSRILHFVLPAFALVDLLVAPGSPALTPRRRVTVALSALVFPLGWTIFTSIRGALTDWYPYFFISPIAAGGVGAVVGYCCGLAVLLVAVVLAVDALRGTSPAARPRP